MNVAFEAIGAPQTFRQATEVAADGGRCVMVGIAPVGLTAEIEITRLVSPDPADRHTRQARTRWFVSGLAPFGWPARRAAAALPGGSAPRSDRCCWPGNR